MSKKRLYINGKIRARTVRLIDDEGNQLGIKSIEDALRAAEEKELDLVEVSPKANPPVCKILNFGKYLYTLKKLEKKQKKLQKQTEIKGIRLGFKTDVGDIKIKLNRAIKFLEQGNGLKVALILRGREAMYADMAKEKLVEFAEGLKEHGKIELAPKRQGYTIFMIITPQK